MVLQHVDVGKLMGAMSESSTPSISGTPTSGVSSIMQPNPSSSSPGSIITEVIKEIGKQLEEIPKDTSNTSNRFFRDVGKNRSTNVHTNVPTNTNIPTIKNEPSSKDLKEISRVNWRAQIETGIIGSIFGSTAAYIVYYIGFAISLVFKLFILFIIFNICVIIHKAIQALLDVSHKFMGGIKSSLSDINGFLNKVGLDFTIPGVKFELFGKRIDSGNIARINWFPFTNSLGNPINKVDSAKNAIPKIIILNFIKIFF